MNYENTFDNASSLDNIVNLTDIVPPKVKDQNIPAEYLISENFLVSGVITQFFPEKVLFKPNFSNDIFNLLYNQIRHPPSITSDCKYEVGDKVEVDMLDVKFNLHGWARSTIKSIVKDTYVVILDQRRAFVIVQRDKLRTITTGAHLNVKYLYTFNIPVPQELQKLANKIEVHGSFCKIIGNPEISYDFEMNAFVITSNKVNCESLAKMLLAIHFTNLTQRMLLTDSINELEEKFQKMKTEDLVEQFEVHPYLLKYVIGRKGKNIQKAETIPKVTFVAVIKDINIIKIYGQNKAALKEVCEYLQLDIEIIEISNKMIRKVIGKNGQKVQEIADISKLRHIVISTSDNPASEFAELQFIGTSSSIADAKSLLKFHLNDLQKSNQLVLANGNGDVNQQCNTVFRDKNAKSSSESPAEGVPSFKLTRRVFSGCNSLENKNIPANVNGERLEPELIQFTQKQDLIFYNKNQSRGRSGMSSEGKSNTARRSRDRFGYQTTQSRVDDSKAKNATNQIAVKQSQQSTTNSGRSRGRRRGRGRRRRRRLALAPIHDVNSISCRESQKDSSPFRLSSDSSG